MPRRWLVPWALAVGCGGVPVQPAPTPATRAPSATRAAPHFRGEVLVLSGGLGGFDGFGDAAFSEAGIFVGLSALGVHRIDPRSGAERLLVALRKDQTVLQFSVAGSMAVLHWIESGSARNYDVPEHVALIDIDVGRVRALPANDTQGAKLSPDGSRLLWLSSRDARSIVYDTKTAAPLQALVNASAMRGYSGQFAPSGNFVYVRGALFDASTARELWSVPSADQTANQQVHFVTLGGRESLVFAGDKRLFLVQPDTGAVREANVDCMDGSSSWKSTADSVAGVFARLCPRGAVIVDLLALETWAAKKPMLPVRVRTAYEMQFTPAGKMLLATVPGSRQSSGETQWLEYDPRLGKPRPVSAPQQAVSVGGDYAVVLGSSGRCAIQPHAAAALHDAATAPSTVSTSTWLCEAKLSADGSLFLHSGNGALTIGAVAGLKTLVAIGSSRKHLDESLAMRLVVEEGQLVALANAHRISGSSENRFVIERSVPLRNTEFVRADDVGLTSLRVEQRTRALDQLPTDLVDSCSLAGTLTAPQQAALVVCHAESGTETSYRFDPVTFERLPGTHSGQRYAEPDSDPYDPSSQSVGALDDVIVQPERNAAGLFLAQLRDAVSHEIIAHLHVGWDFAIVDDDNGHVQIVGNRARAVTWLRCLEDDGTILPFDACAADAEAKIY